MTTHPSPADAALYVNHRRFLEAQRGALTHHDGFDAIHGDVAAFQIAMLHDARAIEAAAQAQPTVFAPPWVNIGDNSALTPLYRLTHMALRRDGLDAPATHEGISIAIAANDAEIEAFTAVQAEGFANAPSEVGGLRDWFFPKNLRAYKERDQTYYVLRRDGAPASVLLTVDTGDALGIYAVATPPQLRRQGLSSALLRAVCENAPPGRDICLQVLRGSDAERLYAKLGFEERFVVDVYRSERHSSVLA